MLPPAPPNTHPKKQVSMAHTLPKKKQARESEETQMLDLEDKDFKSPIINMFKVLEKTMSQELKKKILSTMPHQIENINKEVEIVSKDNGIGLPWWCSG